MTELATVMVMVKKLVISPVVLSAQVSQIPCCHIEIGIKIHLRRTAHPKPFDKQFDINNLYKSSAHMAKIVKVEE